MSSSNAPPLIESLLALARARDRGALAALRRGLGQPPGTVPAMFPYVEPYLGANAARWEVASYLVAALFASHPSNWVREGVAPSNLGASFARIPARSESLEKRFEALLACRREISRITCDALSHCCVRATYRWTGPSCCTTCSSGTRRTAESSAPGRAHFGATHLKALPKARKQRRRHKQMLVELHILQNFAPSNLNRDDTGSPKDCEFGGFRRARISSQCLKRSIRTAFRDEHLLPADDLARRTKRVVDEVVGRLAAAGRKAEEAQPIVEAALGGIGLSVDDEARTQYLLFIGEREIAALTDLCKTHWDALDAVGKVESGEGRSERQRKRAAKDAVPANIAAAFKQSVDGGRAADLALFGRMLADMPDHNIDAASQVAHAISTNRVSMEFDFYTAVDDLSPREETGAGMMGTVEFTSACFYRYANVDQQQLVTNLNGDTELARRALDAFIRASVSAIPSGKQNSMAAQNPPSFVLAVVRDRGAWSLANAFLQPVRPAEGTDLVENSVAALDSYWQRLAVMYGESGVRAKYACTHVDGALVNLADARVSNLDALVSGVLGSM